MFQSRNGTAGWGRQFARGRIYANWPSFGGHVPELLQEFLWFAGWRRLTAAVATIVLGAIFEGAGILIVIQVVQLLLVTGTPPASPFEVQLAATGVFAGIGAGGQVAASLALVVVAIVARGFLLTARDTLLARLQHGFVQTIKLSLLEKLANARWVDIARYDRSVLVQMLGSEMMQLAMAVHYGLAICVSLVFLVAMAGFAIYLAPTLALLIFGFLGAVLFASAFYVHHSSSYGKRLLDEDLAMSQTALRFLDTIKLARAHGLQHSFLERYAEASARALDQRITFVRLLSASRNGLIAAGALIAVAAMIWGTLVLDVPPLELMAFVVILLRLAGPALCIQQGVQQIANSVPRFALARQLTDSLGMPDRVVSAGLARPLRGGAVVDVRHVGLERSTGSSAPGNLVDISFVAQSGEIVGLSGPSGSGKTTLLDIICGLLEPSSGTVRVDGSVPSANCDRIYLGQEPGLYAGSLRDNMLWFAPGSSDSAMTKALLELGGERFLERMPKGLDTAVADGGGNLSAGERQRVALARAILRNPRLILLDEATSSLDRASEASVLEVLRALPTTPTIILVSHRRETLSACDRIVELSGGRLVDPAPRRPSECAAKHG